MSTGYRLLALQMCSVWLNPRKRKDDFSKFEATILRNHLGKSEITNIKSSRKVHVCSRG
jgi:hypothetical protein